MPKTCRGRLVFAMIVCAALLVIGRNLSRRRLNSQLLAAVERHDLRAARALLAAGADAQSARPFSGGNSARFALDTAVADCRRDESAQIACLLIERGALRRAASPARNAYLEAACTGGSVPLARCLLEHGAEAGFVDANHDTALSHAIAYGLYFDHTPLSANLPVTADQKARDIRISRDLVTLLRRYGARSTPLQAVQMEDAALLREALASPGNVNEQDVYGRTALHVAAEQGNLSLMQMLLAQGADVNASSFSTPLDKAAGRGDLAAVKLLLAHGANVNLASRFFASPLASAAAGGNPAVVRLLLAEGANPNHEPGASYLGTTALAAAVNSTPGAVPDLLARGANPNVIVASLTPLLFAVQAGNSDAVRLLLAHGANPNLKPPRSHTALYFAHLHEKVDIIKTLEQAGAKAE